MFGFPVAKKNTGFKFQQNLLRTVVFQVKFESGYNVLEQRDVLAQAIASTFPHITERKYQDVQVSFVDQTPILSAQQTGTAVLEFRSEDQQKIFSVAETELSLTILGPQYVNYQEVQSDLNNSIYKVGALLGISLLNRVAIRKINIVNFQPPEGFSASQTEEIYRTVFHNLLTVSASATPSASYLFSAISNYSFRQDEHRLNLVYGLLPELAPDGARQFVLDIDLANLSSEQLYANLASNFLAINDEIFNIFSWSISPSLLQLINSVAPTPAV